MLLDASSRSPRAARVLLVLALLELVIAIAWPKIAAVAAPSMNPDTSDSVHGFLFGLAFGLLLIGVLGVMRARR